MTKPSLLTPEELKEIQSEADDSKTIHAEADLAGWVPNLLSHIEAQQEALRELRKAWYDSWDCSRDPGHSLMGQALTNTSWVDEYGDYHEKLKEIDRLWGSHSDTPEGQRLDRLITSVEAQEVDIFIQGETNEQSD